MIDIIFVYGFIVLLTGGMHYTWPVDYKGTPRIK